MEQHLDSLLERERDDILLVGNTYPGREVSVSHMLELVMACSRRFTNDQYRNMLLVRLRWLKSQLSNIRTDNRCVRRTMELIGELEQGHRMMTWADVGEY